jgi:hypothetical protein
VTGEQADTSPVHPETPARRAAHRRPKPRGARSSHVMQARGSWASTASTSSSWRPATPPRRPGAPQPRPSWRRTPRSETRPARPASSRPKCVASTPSTSPTSRPPCRTRRRAPSHERPACPPAASSREHAAPVAINASAPEASPRSTLSGPAGAVPPAPVATPPCGAPLTTTEPGSRPSGLSGRRSRRGLRRGVLVVATRDPPATPRRRRTAAPKTAAIRSARSRRGQCGCPAGGPPAPQATETDGPILFAYDGSEQAQALSLSGVVGCAGDLVALPPDAADADERRGHHCPHRRARAARRAPRPPLSRQVRI